MASPANAKDLRPRAPVSDSIIIAVARLVDDAQTEPERQSIQTLNFRFLAPGPPLAILRYKGKNVGKVKRGRATLSWELYQAPVRLVIVSN